ncbi:MAG: E3 binding domain-containing protein, partial [Pseudomonadota bacterium]
MPIQILMPALSPTMEEGKLSAWLIGEGEEVRPGAVIAEIETDKATMEVEAVDEGRIGKILIAAGTEAVKVNTPIALLLEEGEDPGSLDQAATASPQPIALQAETPEAPTAPPPMAERSNGARIFASPLARRIAAQKGVDLTALTGSGPRGRIVKADVEAVASGTVDAPAPPMPAPAAQSGGTPPAPALLPASSSAASVARLYQGRRFQERALDPMRRTVAQRLTEAKQTIPHFYLRRTVMLDPLLDLRRRMNAALEGRGVKLSVNDFIIRAAAL